MDQHNPISFNWWAACVSKCLVYLIFQLLPPITKGDSSLAPFHSLLFLFTRFLYYFLNVGKKHRSEESTGAANTLKDDSVFGQMVTKAGIVLKAKNKPNEISKCTDNCVPNGVP